MYHKGVSVALAATAPCCHHGQQSPSGVETPKQIDRKPSANHPGGVPCQITRHATPRGLHRQRRSRVQRSAGQLQARSTVTHQPSSVRLSCGIAGELHQLLCLHKTTLPNNDGPALSCSLYTCMDQRDKIIYTCDKPTTDTLRATAAASLPQALGRSPQLPPTQGPHIATAYKTTPTNTT